MPRADIPTSHTQTMNTHPNHNMSAHNTHLYTEYRQHTQVHTSICTPTCTYTAHEHSPWTQEHTPHTHHVHYIHTDHSHNPPAPLYMHGLTDTPMHMQPQGLFRPIESSLMHPPPPPCLYILFSLTPGVCIYGTIQSTHTDQNKPLDSCKNDHQDPGRLSLCVEATTPVGHSPSPRKALQQRSTCTRARHLYFSLPLIKSHNKMAHQGARHYSVIKVNISQGALPELRCFWCFYFHRSVEASRGKIYCGRSLRRPAASERWAGQAAPSLALISLRKGKGG